MIGDKEFVKLKYPRAICWHRPYLSAECRMIFNPPRDLTYLDIGNGDALSDVFDTDEEAWKDAREKIENEV